MGQAERSEFGEEGGGERGWQEARVEALIQAVEEGLAGVEEWVLDEVFVQQDVQAAWELLEVVVLGEHFENLDYFVVMLIDFSIMFLAILINLIFPVFITRGDLNLPIHRGLIVINPNFILFVPAHRHNNLLIGAKGNLSQIYIIIQEKEED